MSAPQDIAVILVAAGRGSRMGGGLPKQWRPVAGRPVIAHTVDAFRAAGLSRIVVAIHPDDHERAATLDLPLVHGGATRARSVRNALEALANDPPSNVLIHDAARPLVSTGVIKAVIDALQTHRAAAPGVPVTDALWRGVEGRVAATVPRDGLFRAQTPQGFHFEPILAAHRGASADAADDVEIARAAGIEVWITPGCDENIKLTYPDDFVRAERVISERLTK